MVILGIDPGSHRTGYGFISREGRHLKLIDGGTIAAVRGDPLSQRIRLIHEQLLALIDEHHPEIMAVEGVFHASNARSALILGHARGAILLAGALRDLPIREYAPRKIKSALTGNGAADKEQIRFMVTRLLSLPAPPSSLDTSDALAVAICQAIQTVDGPAAAAVGT